MAPKATITFDDGTTAEVVVKPALLVRAERKFKGNIPPIEGVLYACWLKLQPGVPFEQWMDTVDNLDQSEGEAPVPLDGELSAGG